MSFNLEGDGTPICVMKIDGKKEKLVYLDEKSNSTNNYPELQLTQGTFQFIPNKDKERTILYVVGASGSGKSYYTASYALEYHRMFPKRPIYILSYVDSDSSIERIKTAKRIRLTKEFIDTELNADDFAESLVIFDDCDCISDKPLKLKIKDILTKLLNTGRHTKTSVVYLSHIATNGVETKGILNEAHAIVFFPQSLGGRTRKYLMENYLGLNKKQQQRLDTIDSRAITIVKSYPMCILAESEIYTLKNF
jgi:ABC-type dipeptide/oligopeptide/nickel transport system ATPase component